MYVIDSKENALKFIEPFCLSI